MVHKNKTPLKPFGVGVLVGVPLTGLLAASIYNRQQTGIGYTHAQISTLIRQFNGDPDPLHFEWTPAMDGLIDIGMPALPYVLDLVLDESLNVRKRAIIVMMDIVAFRFGIRRGQEYKSEQVFDAIEAWWKKMGDLSAEDSYEKRKETADIWRSWLDDVGYSKQITIR